MPTISDVIPQPPATLPLPAGAATESSLSGILTATGPLRQIAEALSGAPGPLGPGARDDLPVPATLRAGER